MPGLRCLFGSYDPESEHVVSNVAEYFQLFTLLSEIGTNDCNDTYHFTTAGDEIVCHIHWFTVWKLRQKCENFPQQPVWTVSVLSLEWSRGR